MDLRKFLIRLVSLIFFIFLMNYLAMIFHWYSSIWYLDMPMHFLGGIWLGLAIIWFFKVKEVNLQLVLKIILGVFLIGIFWEIFEILVNDYIIQNPFNILDTLSDLFFDLAGGFFAIFYFLKRIMSIEGNAV